MDIVYDYYEVKPKGNTATLIARFFAEVHAKRAEQLALQKEFGAAGFYSIGGRMAALSFDGETAALRLPPGFFHKKGDELLCFRPDLRTKLGKAIDARFQAASPPTAIKLTQLLGGDWVTVGRGPGTSFGMRAFKYETFGKHAIIGVPRFSSGEPGWRTPRPDCPQIKVSKYHQIRERYPLDAKAQSTET